jgi:hypothetical protein
MIQRVETGVSGRGSFFLYIWERERPYLLYIKVGKETGKEVKSTTRIYLIHEW